MMVVPGAAQTGTGCSGATRVYVASSIAGSQTSGPNKQASRVGRIRYLPTYPSSAGARPAAGRAAPTASRVVTPGRASTTHADTLEDARFQRNQFATGPPFVRFYCGAPLVRGRAARACGSIRGGGGGGGGTAAGGGLAQKISSALLCTPHAPMRAPTPAARRQPRRHPAMLRLRRCRRLGAGVERWAHPWQPGRHGHQASCLPAGWVGQRGCRACQACAGARPAEALRLARRQGGTPTHDAGTRHDMLQARAAARLWDWALHPDSPPKRPSPSARRHAQPDVQLCRAGGA